MARNSVQKPSINYPMNQSMFISACVAVRQNVASYRHYVYIAYDTIRYDTIEEFNVDSKSECD